VLGVLFEVTPCWSGPPDSESGQTLLSGMGELQVEVAVTKLREAGVAVTAGRPQVSYRETVVRGVTGLVHRHVKQDGGAGQFAHVVLDVAPLDGTGFAFASTVTGGRIPAEFVRAVEAGCREALAHGPLAGHPVAGLQVTLTDGATHVKDSSEMAFRAAGRFGLRAALEACELALLEPVADVTVHAPAETLGGVLGDLASRRGRVTGSTGESVTAVVPLAELFGYATDLRSRTRGRGTFATRPAGYRPV
jgi:elongation factor G